jgi:elongation factor G
VYERGQWLLLEPIMKVEATGPIEFQGNVVATLSRRSAVITGTDSVDEYFTVTCEVRELRLRCFDCRLIY